MASQLVWIHHFNANELGLSVDGTGTGRGSFCLVPVAARGIFLPVGYQESEVEEGFEITLYLPDIDTSLEVKYSKPPSKAEHRLSLAGLSKHIGLGSSYLINPEKIACFYRKGDEICLTLAEINSAYGRLLKDFPYRGKNNNLVTTVVFDLDNETTYYSQPLKTGKNILFYGVAGVGKSYNVNKMVGGNPEFVERIVFHPDYLNTDFVGQILPKVNSDGRIEYQFKAGPFTRVLKKALENPENHYYLVIEEINRGNAPAIFGEIFQLLDRKDDGVSTYCISHDLIAEEVFENPGKPIYIPSNLTILATMNTADQNVFTLDTAFQRRWQMQIMENKIDECSFKGEKIIDTGVSWGHFNKTINHLILEKAKDAMYSEDKRLGAYFVKANELSQQSDTGYLFAEKVIKYLWDDVFKFQRTEVFQADLVSLDQVLTTFNISQGQARFKIFIDEIYEQLTSDLMVNHFLDDGGNNRDVE